MRTIIAAGALAVMLAGPVGAEPGPIGRWLMDQPVTLWDRGMDRALMEAKEAAKHTGPRPPRTVREGHAYYDWNANEIVLRMDVFGEAGADTHERCNELRRRFLSALAVGIPTMFEGTRRSMSTDKKSGLPKRSTTGFHIAVTGRLTGTSGSPRSWRGSYSSRSRYATHTPRSCLNAALVSSKSKRRPNPPVRARWRPRGERDHETDDHRRRCAGAHAGRASGGAGK